MSSDLIEIFPGCLVEVRLDVVSCVDIVRGLGEGIWEVVPILVFGNLVRTF